uniref:Calponin-homology (CH) domain-containing protein n=1 Tax=Lynx canadensis TaxID=61383 RepID=A0A667I3F2_LYNCA
METERGSFISRDVETPKKEVHLRVTPSEVKFLDTLAGRVYRLPVTVHNLGRCNQKIRFQEPLKPQFKLILTNLDKALASGLQMTAMVEYHPDKDEDTYDQLLISIGNKIIEIPLLGLIPACQLEIESEVNFGTLVANSKVYCKEINIINHGRAPGTFKTEYQGQLPIVIFPSNGVVESKSSVIVKVDLCADQPRIVNEVAKVSLQGRPDMLLRVKAHVVEQIIELLNMSGDKKLECIHFGSVFFGTSKIEHALLYNNNPEPINWVAIIQDDSVGEELGTNIQQRTDVALNNLPYLSRIKNIDVTTFISCIPNEGRLLPYQKTIITFCFSPKLIIDGKKNYDPSHRQDYALFLRFESVGSKDGFLRDDNNKTIKSDRFRKVELALTGSGLPVILHFDPGNFLNFAPCFMGERSETVCIMQNRSKSLSVTYRFKKTAHFKIDPERGKIDEGCIQNVICSFIPHQVGVFKVKQLMEIIGSVADENFQSTSLKPFHQIYLYFKSVCKPSTKKVVMKVNPGISPLVSNPTGQFVVRDLPKYKDCAPVAMLQSTMTHLHNHHLSKESPKDALIAFPNDRAASIRSGDQHKHFRTIFTKIPRYNYVDPDFAYTKLERIGKQEHENYYERYIKHLRNVRMQKQAESRECMDSYNNTDIGLQPASGLKSPSLSETEIEEELSAARRRIRRNQLLNTRNIASKETKALKTKVLKGLKSDPSTPHEKHDCSLILTPKQIHQVIVGTVEPYSSLQCEVTWQPGFSSPERGEFVLHVNEGNTMTLKCVAQVGHTKVVFLEPRILFSNSPQGLTTWRKAILHNVGQNHAYFKVCDQSLLSTINIVPSQGIIPFGGLTVLNISCTPTVAEKFDTRAKVAIRHANVIDLRIGGSVEIADVEINPGVFNFSGTYVGATQIIPFIIKNKGITRARVEFNLQDFECFSLDFQRKLGHFTDPAFPDIYSLEVEEGTSLECGIAFSPKEVATYDFCIQVQINFFEASELYTKCCLSKSPMIPKTTPLIRPCYVQATVLQAPLRLSSTDFTFEIPLYTMDPNNKVTKTQDLVLHNTSKQDVKWTLDISNTGKLFKDGTFKISVLSGILQPHNEINVSISFCPSHPTKYTADIPIHLNDNPICYRMLCLVGEVKSPKLSFDPPFIFFTPVPLDVTTKMNVNILPQNYFRDSTLDVQIPTVSLLDGDEAQPLSVTFPKGCVITGSSSGINAQLTCHLSFKSSKPVSFFTDILFCDNRDNWFLLPVTGTAENCLLTICPYMATHLDKQTIILKEDKSDISVKSGENVLLPYQEDGLLSSTLTKRNDVEPAKKKLFVGIEIIPERLNSGKSKTSKENKDKSMKNEAKNEHFFSLEEGTKAYDFFEKVVQAAQTWFSLFGWPEGPHSLSIPETIRREVYKMQFYSSASPSQKFSRLNDFSKYNKTIYDVILHLSGKLPPGIHSSQSLPVDYTERVIQLHFQHSSLLDFLNAQGACISHVLPEFLLEPEDYKKWLEITEKPSIVIEMTRFEAWSKGAWTDVFLQIYKVLVLSRVVPHCSSNLPPIHVQNSPKVNPCFVSSNIYSSSERILLNWMNTNYENARHIIWKNCPNGVIPSERWIVNFDQDLLDGLVFATQLGAYCPFLIESHLIHMYTQPKSSEQYLHNCLIIVNVLREIGFDIDIQATDICDPNPILMLMLCVYMYERLPTYLPKKVVPFYCTLHDTVLRQILLKNSSLKNLVYNATIVGKDAADFSLSQTGNIVTISSKNEISITVKFTSRFLHPAEASLLLISKPKHGIGGTTMTFALKGEVLNFKAIEIINCKSPCYTWKEITVKVKNPFHSAGDFSVTLVESSTFISLPSQLTESGQLINHKNSGDAGSSPESGDVESCWHFSNALKTSIKSTFIREFFCSTHTLHLGVKRTSSLELLFLPFDMHTRYCVIILRNKAIGELIYVVEGKGTIPLPSSFHPTDSSTPLDYSSSPEEVLSKDSPVLYLKCELRQVLDVDLKLPLTNEAKEKALAFAAQQQMSDIEYERRLITGTLESSSVRVAIALLGLTKIETCVLFTTSKLKKPKSISYTAELSLPEHFDIPKKIYIPQIPETQTKLTQPQGIQPANKTVADGSVLVPLRFVPLSAGRYPCKILLTSWYDVRVYCIEGIVNAEEPEARFEFETPAFEALTQNIPVNNKTKNEWKCQVTIEGEWFYGPSVLYVGAGETVQYPLTFRPILECEIMGRLIVQNEADGMEYVFDIKGIGKRPLALEHIIINCQVGEMTNKPIMVPNHTKTIQTFKVSSDLPMVWGNPVITIDSDSTIPYILHVLPWKRGIFKGAISFSVKRRQEDESQQEPDQDDNQVPSFQKSLSQPSPQNTDDDSGAISFSVKRRQEDESQEEPDQHDIRVPSFQKSVSELSPQIDEEDPDDGASNIRVWYSLEIHSSPGPPVDIIEMKCSALESICIEIPLSNPKKRIIHLDVQLSNAALNGLKKLQLYPLECTKYVARYSPATPGCRDESIVFQPNVALEFWYLLRLTTELPKPTTIPEVQCDLGKCMAQMISLVNPTHETLELQATNSNPENFVLDVHRSVLTIPPHSTKEVSVHFCPSALGRTGHQASIIFHCAQFTEWRFFLSGIGLFPQPIDIKRITAYLSLQSSVVITFQNPTKEDVLIDIILTSREKPRHLILDHHWDKFFRQTSAFSFSGLSHTKGITLPPKENIDIPVLFMPNTMKLHRTMVIVQMMRANRESWPIDNFEELDTEMKRTMGTASREIPEIHWIYPILGLPQALYPKCPPDMSIKREFEYEIQFESDVVKSNLESCMALYLIKKSFNVMAKVITLVFNLIFAPKKPLRTQITLKIECITDGIWKFPITLVGTEPDVDDVIDIEGVGLFKESIVNFRLTSQTRNPEPFTAYFLPGSDPAFFVKPKVGKLLPFDTEGTLIIVGFKPQMYSRKYKATLAIQTPDMYWLYDINGLPQVTKPLMNVKAKVDTTNKMFDRRPVGQHNFIRENAKLIRTGVSSTIKGAPLMLKNK